MGMGEMVNVNVRLGSTSSNISYSNNDICRICHCEADNGNPLLAPCYCAGSLKFVHQGCLQQWLTASETRSCELCKFNFIMHTKIKPFNEWRRLEMSGVERRRLCCAVSFHCVAALCVIWSLFVLIDRATEEVQKGLVDWPFWTKLVVVAVGFIGGAVFMYIQCRQYLHLCYRWRAHNRIILIQNAPEKSVAPPSPTFRVSIRPPITPGCVVVPSNQSQIIANIENNPINNFCSTVEENPSTSTNKCSDIAIIGNNSYIFGERNNFVEPEITNTSDDSVYGFAPLNQTYNIIRSEAPSKSSNESPGTERGDEMVVGGSKFDELETHIQEMLALDIEHHKCKRNQVGQNSMVSLQQQAATSQNNNFQKSVLFKSLPNLSSSNEKLLP